MNTRQIVGVVLVALGVLGALLGQLSFTTEEHSVEFGPVGMEIEEKQRIPVPLWLSIGLIAAGGAILITGRGRRT